jgi:hypothetical protein
MPILDFYMDAGDCFDFSSRRALAPGFGEFVCNHGKSD